VKSKPNILVPHIEQEVLFFLVFVSINLNVNPQVGQVIIWKDFINFIFFYGKSFFYCKNIYVLVYLNVRNLGRLN
jgi:hypothetical protein